MMVDIVQMDDDEFMRLFKVEAPCTISGFESQMAASSHQLKPPLCTVCF